MLNIILLIILSTAAYSIDSCKYELVEKRPDLDLYLQPIWGPASGLSICSNGLGSFCTGKAICDGVKGDVYCRSPKNGVCPSAKDCALAEMDITLNQANMVQGGAGGCGYVDVVLDDGQKIQSNEASTTSSKAVAE